MALRLVGIVMTGGCRARMRWLMWRGRWRCSWRRRVRRHLDRGEGVVIACACDASSRHLLRVATRSKRGSLCSSRRCCGACRCAVTCSLLLSGLSVVAHVCWAVGRGEEQWQRWRCGLYVAFVRPAARPQSIGALSSALLVGPPEFSLLDRSRQSAGFASGPQGARSRGGGLSCRPGS